MSRRGRLLRVAAVLGVAAAAGWTAWQFVQPRVVTVVHPVRGPAVQAVYATGTVEAGITVRLAPQTAGRIIELLADEGKDVKAGDVLARLDDRDMRAASAELEARFKYAEQQYQRVEELSKRGWVTRDKVDQARAERDAARHAAQRLTQQTSFLTLTAPTDGQIIRRDGEVGDYIPLNQPIFYMAKAGAPPRITADVDEEDIPLVRAGQKVLIRADAFPEQVFEGDVAEITPKGDPVARSYRVRISLPENTPLRIGMTAETNIVTRENPNALVIPINALPSGDMAAQNRSPVSSVWVVRQDRAEKQAVRLGIRGREKVEITEGLTESDEVITAPQKLEPGRAVTVKRETPPKAGQPATPAAPPPAPAPASAATEPKTGPDQ